MIKIQKASPGHGWAWAIQDMNAKEILSHWHICSWVEPTRKQLINLSKENFGNESGKPSPEAIMVPVEIRLRKPPKGRNNAKI
jgi:hypothetical protein